MLGEDFNPMCKEFNYREHCFKNVPALKRLDGIQEGIAFAGFEQ